MLMRNTTLDNISGLGLYGWPWLIAVALAAILYLAPINPTTPPAAVFITTVAAVGILL